MKFKATRSTFASVYFRIAVVACGVLAGFFFLSRFYVVPAMIQARTDSILSLLRSHEQDIILNKTRSVRDELQAMHVIAGDEAFHNYDFSERPAVEAALKNCAFYSTSACLGKNVSVFLQGNSSRPPKEQFNFAVVLDSNLVNPPAIYYGIESLITIIVGFAFWLIYRGVARKEDYLVSRLNTAGLAFSRTKTLFSLDGGVSDEFDAFGKSAEHLVRGFEEFKAKFERKTRLEQLGLIVGQVSHDLKAPFNEAENFLSQMPYFLEHKPHEQILEGTNSLIRRMQHGRESLNRALSLTKQSTVAREDVSLKKVFQNVLARVKQNEKLAALSVDLSISTDAELLGDNIQLETAFLNLLENTADEKRNARVSLECTRLQADKAQIFYTDDGGGIPEEFLEKVFEPLVTFKTSGTGFGLGSTREIFSVHGGSIRAVQHRGGAKFEIVLPLSGGANA